MSGNSVNNLPSRALSIKSLSIPFNINGEIHAINCAVTTYGHPLINASQYATAFTGCTPKDATNKLCVVANRFPRIQHSKRQLREHDNVSLLIFIDHMMYSHCE